MPFSLPTDIQLNLQVQKTRINAKLLSFLLFFGLQYDQHQYSGLKANLNMLLKLAPEAIYPTF
jgi:hypothetical protein